MERLTYELFTDSNVLFLDKRVAQSNLSAFDVLKLWRVNVRPVEDYHSLQSRVETFELFKSVRDKLFNRATRPIVVFDQGSRVNKVLKYNGATIAVVSGKPEHQENFLRVYTGIRPLLKKHFSGVGDIGVFVPESEALRRLAAELDTIVIDVGGADCKLVAPNRVTGFTFCKARLGIIREVLEKLVGSQVFSECYDEGLNLLEFVNAGELCSAALFFMLLDVTCSGAAEEQVIDYIYGALASHLVSSIEKLIGDNFTGDKTCILTGGFFTDKRLARSVALMLLHHSLFDRVLLPGEQEVSYATALGALLQSVHDSKSGSTVRIEGGVESKDVESVRGYIGVYNTTYTAKPELHEFMLEFEASNEDIGCYPISVLIRKAASGEVIRLPYPADGSVPFPFDQCPVYKTPDILKLCFGDSIEFVPLRSRERFLNPPCGLVSWLAEGEKHPVVDGTCIFSGIACSKFGYHLVPSNCISIALSGAGVEHKMQTYGVGCLYCVALELSRKTGVVLIRTTENDVPMCVFKFFQPPEIKPEGMFKLVSRLSENRKLGNARLLVTYPPGLGWFIIDEFAEHTVLTMNAQSDKAVLGSDTVREISSSISELQKKHTLPFEVYIFVGYVQVLASKGLEFDIAFDARCPSAALLRYYCRSKLGNGKIKMYGIFLNKDTNGFRITKVEV